MRPRTVKESRRKSFRLLRQPGVVARQSVLQRGSWRLAPKSPPLSPLALQSAVASKALTTPGDESMTLDPQRNRRRTAFRSLGLLDRARVVRAVDRGTKVSRSHLAPAAIEYSKRFQTKPRRGSASWF